MKQYRLFDYSMHFRTIVMGLGIQKRDYELIRSFFVDGIENTKPPSNVCYSPPSKSRILNFFLPYERAKKNNLMTEVEFNIFMIGVKLKQQN